MEREKKGGGEKRDVPFFRSNSETGSTRRVNLPKYALETSALVSMNIYSGDWQCSQEKDRNMDGRDPEVADLEYRDS